MRRPTIRSPRASRIWSVPRWSEGPGSAVSGRSWQLPGQRIGLRVAVALHRFEYALLVAQPRVLDAADLELADEAGDQVHPIGAERGGQSVGGAVGDADRLVHGLEADHG